VVAVAAAVVAEAVVVMVVVEEEGEALAVKVCTVESLYMTLVVLTTDVNNPRARSTKYLKICPDIIVRSVASLSSVHHL